MYIQVVLHMHMVAQLGINLQMTHSDQPFNPEVQAWLSTFSHFMNTLMLSGVLLKPACYSLQ